MIVVTGRGYGADKVGRGVDEGRGLEVQERKGSGRLWGGVDEGRG